MITLHVVEDDPAAAKADAQLAREMGFRARTHPAVESFFAVAGAEEDGVVLLDLALSGRDGLEVLREFAARGMDLPVVAVSAAMTVPLASRAMAAGAVAAVERQAPLCELRAALMTAAGIEEARRERRRLRREAAARFASLNDREREVLGLLLDGLPNKAVAGRLDLSMRTIERHRASALAVLGVANLVEAAELRLLAHGAHVGPAGPHVYGGAIARQVRALPG